MSTEFGNLVSEYTKKIVDEMQRLRSSRTAIAEKSIAPAAILPDPAAPYLEIDLSSAERTASGSYIFAEPSQDQTANWCVFELNDQNDSTYKFHSAIQHNCPTDEFLEKAYKLILMRPIDPDGRAAYSRHIESGQLTRREVFIVLANSGEAEERHRNLLIIPEPSSWLASHDFQSSPENAPLISAKL